MLHHPLDKARQSLAEGRYTAALAAFGSAPPSDPILRVGYAEALIETGDAAAAAKVLERDLADSKQPAGVLAAAHRVLASMHIERGERGAALERLTTAIALAEGAGEWSEGAKASLRLFTHLHSSGGRGDSAQVLQSAKRLVLRANEPRLLAELHSRVGQAEAQSGNLYAAKAHLRRANEITDKHQHFGLIARTRLALSSTLALLCDNKSAAAEARAAHKAAEVAGSVALARLCQANVAQLLLRTGATGSAARRAKELLDGAPLSAPLRLAVLETYVSALLEIEADPTDAEEAREFLESMAKTSDPSWVAIEAVPTQARLLMTMSGAPAAIAALVEGRKKADTRRHTDGICRLSLLQAEIAFATGDAAAGRELTAVATAAAGPSPSAEIIGLLERARALVAVSVGLRSSAHLHFKRSERVLAGCGLKTEALRSRRIRRGRLEFPAHLPSAETKRSHALLAAAADAPFLSSLASYPRVLATELVDTLIRARVVRSATVSSADLDALDGASVIQCGRDGDRAIAVDYIAESDYVCRERLLMLTRAVSMAVDARAREGDREVYAGFFGIDHAPEAKRGLYVSTPMRALLNTIRQIGRTDIPVLVTGETGTGKEIVAEELHACSPRAQKPFVPLNVTAVPRELLEGQLFGYRRGAFTGAVSDHKGVIRDAEGGTLFIDEIGELGPELQPKLLRFLESGEIQPLGERPQRVDVRVVAATNASLEQMVREGRFREDLFYRLNVIQLSLPPLRDRREEIPTLVHHFLTRHARDAGKPIPQLSAQALERLSAYDWPGNVRQLTNELKRLVALADENDIVDIGHLAPHIRTPPPRPTAADGDAIARVRLDQTLQEMYDEVDRIAIPWAMRASRNNQRVTAQRLGITRKGLYLKRMRQGLVPQAS